ncbi:MAG: hypothetical protein JXA09_08730 [Anaerolineae bacterium]|nr:hypothetical protein [Anaerolineae bacterium]
MPFATKFRATMGLPFEGDTIGGFVVEQIEVAHQGEGMGRYIYPVYMVLCGAGGRQGVRAALKDLLAAHAMTFSGYGNAYQLWFGKPQIESLGDKRYAVRVTGAGARVYLEGELERFLGYLDEGGWLAAGPVPAAAHDPVETYMDRYRAQIKHRADRYRGKLRRDSGGEGGGAK